MTTQEEKAIKKPVIKLEGTLLCTVPQRHTKLTGKTIPKGSTIIFYPLIITT